MSLFSHRHRMAVPRKRFIILWNWMKIDEKQIAHKFPALAQSKFYAIPRKKNEQQIKYNIEEKRRKRKIRKRNEVKKKKKKKLKANKFAFFSVRSLDGF